MNKSMATSDVFPAYLPHMPLVKMPQFTLHAADHGERPRVEAYIKSRFLKAHGAEIKHFLPTLISMRCQDQFTAAVGLASAANSTLFAEYYLAHRVEQSISARVGYPVERTKIMEIGNLVSSWKGSSLMLFTFLSELIARAGFDWVLFTATREVENLLARMHYLPIILAEADPNKLPDGGASWGSYYQRQPRVMVGDVRNAVAAARKNPLYRAAVHSLNSQIDKVSAAAGFGFSQPQAPNEYFL